MHPGHLKIEAFNYLLPDERIAHHPLAERDASALLVYKEGSIQQDIYRNIGQYIPEGSLLVFNQTKVVNARLLFSKPTGGAIEIFCLEPHRSHGDIQTAMLQKGQVWWHCLVGSAKKWKDGAVLMLKDGGLPFTLSATMVARSASDYTIQLDWNDPELTFAEVLHYAGKVPLPPYINRQAEENDAERYQTIFAKEEGSVAAPTAGLHFTDRVMESLRAKGVKTALLTLHVGAGTFKPVKSDTLFEHDMHAEWIEADRACIEQILAQKGKQIVATGTTSLRTLESLYHIGNKLVQGRPIDWQNVAVNQWDPYENDVFCSLEAAMQALLNYLANVGTDRLITRTQILIAPGYTFRVVDGLVTNFHQPQSTLLLLISALIGGDWHKVYDYALANSFRFLSYGDGSLLWRNG